MKMPELEQARDEHINAMDAREAAEATYAADPSEENRKALERARQREGDAYNRCTTL